MYRILSVLIAVTFLSLAAFSQSYDDLVGKVKGGDTSVDFKALRMAAAERTAPAPLDPRIYPMMVKLSGEKKYKEALKAAETVQTVNFADMNSHIIASMSYAGIGDDKKAKFHEAIYVGLVNSILNNGDGNSAKTSYTVYSTAEVAVVLNALDLKRVSHEIVNEENRKFAVLTVADKNTNEQSKVYFNIDKAGKGFESPVTKKLP